jgi:antitoxin (DNA-binding transcriptional repressor) of toxin-antitoxin stability system
MSEEFVNIHAAKTHLSRLVQSIRDGTAREFVIAVGGKPAARLVPYEPLARRPLGLDDGSIWISDDFDADNEEIRALFEDGPIE